MNTRGWVCSAMEGSDPKSYIPTQEHDGRTVHDGCCVLMIFIQH